MTTCTTTHHCNGSHVGSITSGYNAGYVDALNEQHLHELRIANVQLGELVALFPYCRCGWVGPDKNEKVRDITDAYQAHLPT